MEAVQLWAGVSFSARGGHTEGLLNDAAGAGLQLAAVVHEDVQAQAVLAGQPHVAGVID